MTSKSTVKRVAAQRGEPVPTAEDFISCGDCDAHNPPGTAFCIACNSELDEPTP